MKHMTARRRTEAGLSLLASADPVVGDERLHFGCSVLCVNDHTTVCDFYKGKITIRSPSNCH